MSTIETTKVEEVKDAILDKITERLAEADDIDKFTELEKLAATYRHLADSRRPDDA